MIMELGVILGFILLLSVFVVLHLINVFSKRIIFNIYHKKLASKDNDYKENGAVGVLE